MEIMRAESFSVEQVFGIDPVDVTLYGEGYGARIQKGGGKYLAKSCDFVLFDVKIGDWWLRREAVDEIAIERAMRGQRVKLTDAEFMEAVVRLAS